MSPCSSPEQTAGHMSLLQKLETNSDIFSTITKALLEGFLSLLLAGIPRPPVMHIWKIYTCLWFRKDSLVSPSQLFLSCHPILLLNKWLLPFKPHSFPILANHSYRSISCNCFMPNYPFTCRQIINLHAIASYVMHIEFTLIRFISFCSKWNRLKIASI